MNINKISTYNFGQAKFSHNLQKLIKVAQREVDNTSDRDLWLDFYYAVKSIQENLPDSFVDIKKEQGLFPKLSKIFPSLKKTYNYSIEIDGVAYPDHKIKRADKCNNPYKVYLINNAIKDIASEQKAKK